MDGRGVEPPGASLGDLSGSEPAAHETKERQGKPCLYAKGCQNQDLQVIFLLLRHLRALTLVQDQQE